MKRKPESGGVVYVRHVRLTACVVSCGCQMNVTDRGAQCNRAIMIITDGAPDTYEDIFAKYNWPYKDVSRLVRCRIRLYATLFTSVCLFVVRTFLPLAITRN